MRPSRPLAIAGDSAVSPPASGTRYLRASARKPSMNLSSHAAGSRAGTASERKTASGSAPIAAKSLRPRARQRWPADSGGCHSRRKCLPSSVKSVVTQISCPREGRRTAQSSPTPRGTARDPDPTRAARRRIVSISSSSPEIMRNGAGRPRRIYLRSAYLRPSYPGMGAISTCGSAGRVRTHPNLWNALLST
jgi:hypothetical protein